MELVLSGRLKGNSNVFGHCQNTGILSLEGFVSGTTGSSGSGRAPLSYTEKGEEQIPSSLKDCWRAWDVEPSHVSWKSSSTIYYLVYQASLHLSFPTWKMGLAILPLSRDRSGNRTLIRYLEYSLAHINARKCEL